VTTASDTHGAPLETAAEAAGIHVSTLYRWLDRGLVGEEPYAAFCEAVTRARARGELNLLRTVRIGDGQGVGFGGAKASAWLLERTRPAKYAQRVNVKVEDAIGKVIEVVRGICSAEDFARILEGLERLDSEAGEAGASEFAGGEPADVH
jgi:hypothetical protein